MTAWALLGAWALAAGAGAAEDAKPPAPTIVAKLVLKTDTYRIDPAQEGDAFVRKLRELSRRGELLPEPPAVEMTFTLTNTGARPVTINLGGDASRLDLKLEGPGAITVPSNHARTMEFRVGRDVAIEPGKSLEIPVKRLWHGERGNANASYWTTRGEYLLTASYTSTIEEDRTATFTAPAVKVKVVAP
jgi:hypothetical protein